MNNKRDKANYTILAVSHALDLLELFDGDHDEFGVDELCGHLKMYKNNVLRLLATLESRNYVERENNTAHYRLGLKALELGQVCLCQSRLIRRARPVLEQLTQNCNETSMLTVLNQDSLFHLDAVESTHVVRIVPRVGSSFAAFRTTAGKVQLAYLPEDDPWRRAASDRFAESHSAVLSERCPFEEELRTILRNGYALDCAAQEADLCSIAAPFKDFSGAVVGAVSVAGPLNRFTHERLETELIPLTRQAAVAISDRLGYAGQG
jgi:DNA-binding IclR family transcriptional regulator